MKLTLKMQLIFVTIVVAQKSILFAEALILEIIHVVEMREKNLKTFCEFYLTFI